MQAQLTNYHAKYIAHELTRRASCEGLERLSMALFDANVDLQPHQIEAALFALRSPVSKGVILADEVGLGKTIEAALVLCQLWAERKRRLLVICPASIRKQWAAELEEKFNLPAVILDSRAYNAAKKGGSGAPFECGAVAICSLNFAAKMKNDIRSVKWDTVVIDEAHKLRNAHQPSNKTGQAIRFAIEEPRKILLTATPLQNSLMELYGMSSLIDEYMFGEPSLFRQEYTGADVNLDANVLITNLNERQRSLIDQNKHVREQFFLRYLLFSETAGSPSLLNVQAFDHPFAYKLNVATDTVGETKEVNVDLVETFNWLLGLRVHTMDVIRGFHIVTGRLPGPGNNEDGEKALIIWRDTTENPNNKLDEFFRRQNYNTLDQEFDVIYVNGDNNLQNLRKDDQTWKVRLIDEEFHRLMWDVEDV